MRVRAHWLPRAGVWDDEYEDAFAGPVERGGGTWLSVTDGATESAHAGQWANTLANAACEAMPLEDAIVAARRKFAEEVGDVSEGAPWYTSAKAVEGAHATVIAVEILPDGAWTASAVGDCALICVRQGEVIRAWPIDDASAFGNRPELVSSVVDAPLPDIAHTAGRIERGDVMLLCSDAIAAFLLEHGPGDVVGLEEADFIRWVALARLRRMRNDDVTLIEIAL